jgi:hypothetical protein
MRVQNSLIAAVAVAGFLSLVLASNEARSVPVLSCKPSVDCSLVCSDEATFDLSRAVLDGSADFPQQRVFNINMEDKNVDISIPLCGSKPVDGFLRSSKVSVGTYDPQSWSHQFLNEKETFGVSFASNEACTLGGQRSTVVRLICDKAVASKDPVIVSTRDSVGCYGECFLLFPVNFFKHFLELIRPGGNLL